MRKFLSLFAVLVLCSILAIAQTQNVTGKVTDQQGQPVPFASIRVKGGKSGVSADADGNFSIKAAPDAVLIVTGTGLTTKEVSVNNSSTVTVQVTRKEANLTEVVVTALGIQKQSKELGYSAQKVTGKDLEQAKPISVVNGLTGKVSGMQINTVNNGIFAPTRVVLRGNRSLTGNNQPLVVVDGSIYYSDMSTLNPDDILDVNVLKGSSAAAVYGSDASNGVILFTTKKGSRGKSSLTFSATVQRESAAYLPGWQTQFGSNGGEQYVNDFNDLSTYIPYENQQYGPRFNGKVVPLGRPLFDSTHQSVPYSATDEKTKFFKPATTTQYNISFSSGDENSRYYLSAQDVDSKSVMPGDYGHRDVFRVGGNKTYGIFSAQYTLSYTSKYQNTTNTGAVYDLVLNTPAHVPLTSLQDWVNNKNADPNGFYNDYFDNPYWYIGNYRNKTHENDLTGNVTLNLKPTNWLTLTYKLGVNDINTRFDFEQGPLSFSTWAKTYPTVLYSNASGTGVDSVDEAGKYIAQYPAQAAYNTWTNSNFLLTSDFFASVVHDLGRDFKINGTVGVAYIDNKINYLNVNANNIFLPVYNVNNLTGIPTLGQSNYEARKLGYFAEAQLGYRDLAFIHGSFRSDVDSRLSKENRFIPYYDIDGSLIISDLFPDISNGRVINFIKLRGAYSVTGNTSALANGSQYIAYGAYATNPTFNSATGLGFPYSGLGGYQLSPTIANPNIKPETVTETEVGLDVGLLQNRLTFTAAAYMSKLTDGIVYARIPSSSGFTQALVNAANTQNKGVELSLTGTVLKTSNVTWNIGVNYSHNESKVVTINGGQPSLGLGGANPNAYVVVGQSFPVIESHDWLRDSATGKVIVNATTGLPSQDPNLKVLGQATPKDIIGFTTSVTWKRFTFSATADYRGGYKIFNTIGQYMDFTGASVTTVATGRQRFVFPNSVVMQDGKLVDNTNVEVNDANWNFWPGLYRNQGANYVVSAAAWKLREVVITYDIPRKVFAGAKIIQRATITVSGRNLLMIRPKTNVWTDPEFSEDTSNAVGRTSESQAPPTRIYGATLSLTF